MNDTCLLFYTIRRLHSPKSQCGEMWLVLIDWSSNGYDIDKGKGGVRDNNDVCRNRKRAREEEKKNSVAQKSHRMELAVQRQVDKIQFQAERAKNMRCGGRSCR